VLRDILARVLADYSAAASNDSLEKHPLAIFIREAPLSN
jgi:hypothetical protein